MDDIQNIQNVDELLAYELTEQEDPTHELWAQLSVGMISADEALLRARELNPQLDEDELEHRVAAFAPPPADVMAKELATILEQHEQRPDTDVAPPIPLRPHRSTRLPRAKAAAGLAAAAAVLVFALHKGTGPHGSDQPPTAQLQLEYVPEWNGWRGPMLGADSTPTTAPLDDVLQLKGTLSVKLRPRSSVDDVEGTILVKGWAQDHEGNERVLNLTPDIGTRGVIEVNQPIDALGLERGNWTITLAVGLESQLAAVASPSELGEKFYVHRKKVRVVN